MENIYNLRELSFEESEDICGGLDFGITLTIIAVCGAVYGAGLAVGEAIYHATH